MTRVFLEAEVPRVRCARHGVVMEAAEFRRGRRSLHSRERAVQAGRRGFWLVVGSCAAVAVLFHVDPPTVPAAAIRPGSLASAAGVIALLAGIGLRRWSFTTLWDRYVSFAVVVSPDQPVVATGPYRLLRHPGYAGMLLICVGLGLSSANRVDLAAQELPTLALILWHTRTEEKVLLRTLDDRYSRYARGRRRLIPLIW